MLTKRIILINKKILGTDQALHMVIMKHKTKPKYIFQVDSDDQFHSSDFGYFWKNRTNYIL